VPGGTHCAQWANNRAMLPGTWEKLQLWQKTNKDAGERLNSRNSTAFRFVYVSGGDFGLGEREDPLGWLQPLWVIFVGQLNRQRQHCRIPCWHLALQCHRCKEEQTQDEKNGSPILRYSGKEGEEFKPLRHWYSTPASSGTSHTQCSTGRWWWAPVW